MGKPINITASTSHAQQLELATAFGGDTAALVQANKEGAAQVASLNAKVDELTAALEAEKEAHAKTLAALTAATAPVAEDGGTGTTTTPAA